MLPPRAAGAPAGMTARRRSPRVAVAVVPVAAGFRLAAAAEVLAGAALVGRDILYRWPVQGWVLGKAFRVSRAAGFAHGIRYARGRPSAAASLLDAPWHAPGPAGRWVLLCMA